MNEVSMPDLQPDGSNRNGLLAIIPARAGSKGVVCKNIRPICGVPMLAYSVAVARKAANIDRVVVSTENEDIAAVAKEYGAEVPFLRPAEMATDTSSPGDSVTYTLNRLHQMNIRPKGYIVLFPTHPFRSVHVVETLASRLLQGYARVETVKPLQKYQHSFLYRVKGTRVKKLLDNGIPSENFSYFRPSGYFIGSRLDYGIPHRDLYVHPLDTPVENVDVDTEPDMLLAEAIVRAKLYRMPSC